MAFALLDEAFPTQGALATHVGVSQARISQNVRTLGDTVERTSQGLVADVPKLSAWLVDTYPQVDHLTSTWVSVTPVTDLSRRIAAASDERDIRYALAGEAAADLIAPWARPTGLTVWSDRMWDMRPLGLVPAPPSAANVVLRVPADPYRLRRTVIRDGVAVLAPWRLWVDLVQSGRGDAAAGVWRHLTRKGSRA